MVMAPGGNLGENSNTPNRFPGPVVTQRLQGNVLYLDPVGGIAPAVDTPRIGIRAGVGAPIDSGGIDGDLYFRKDGGPLTTLYQKRTGAYVGIV